MYDNDVVPFRGLGHNARPAATHGRILTVMAAAGSEIESEFWPATRSSGCTCGSTYTTAILGGLEKNGDNIEEASSDVLTTTKEFADSITCQLLNVVDPRMGHSHDHQFGVQDDQWAQLYHQRTGIPLVHYQERLQQIRRIPPRPIDDITLDWSATEDEVETWNISNPYQAGVHLPGLAMGNIGGSFRAVKKVIRHQATSYMESNPGRDSLANNIFAHRIIKTMHGSSEFNDK